jgi:hypothetical protein
VEDETEKEKIASSIRDYNSSNIARKIIDQNNNVAIMVAGNYTTQTEISEAMMNEILLVDQNLNKLKLTQNVPSGSSSSSSTEDAVLQKFSKKIQDMQSIKSKNQAYIKKCEEEILKIDKKINTDDDYLRKWMGEKKVWLDEVDEFKLKDLTFDKSFSEDLQKTFEFKLMKLIFEGVLLEKVQDQIDDDIRENNSDWVNVVKEEFRLENEMKERLDERIGNARNEMERRNIIRQEEEERDKLMQANTKTKNEILADWKSYFEAIWYFQPITKENYDSPFTHNFSGHHEVKFKNYLEKTKYWTFEHFKKNVFNAWHFKNLYLAADEFILTEKTKENFLDLAVKLRNRKEEDRRKEEEKDAASRNVNILREDRRIFNVNELNAEQKDELVYSFLMEMLKNVQARAELRTIHPKERKLIVDRMVDEKLTFDEALSKTNEIRRTEKKSLVERISVKNFDVYNPLMKSFINLLFLSMGSKRINMFKNNKKEVKFLINLNRLKRKSNSRKAKINKSKDKSNFLRKSKTNLEERRRILLSLIL